ncbi:MAG: CopD family protein [Burkholderiales bacterium]|nr:CopD family protein [Burkholderiales bacterium]MDE2299609.1 CopD family protein [Burkholderiales bacterium]MDE2628772.1 CopD family protein [Burkholderiales bacterium]
MLYAALKAVHLLSLVAWVGGMFFALTCLRPALAPLDGPVRLRLMTEVLRRFFDVVGIAIGLMLVSGAWMLWSAMRVSTTRGLAFNMPLDWMAMITLGLVMVAVFGHIRFNLFKRLQRAVRAQDWPAGAAVHGRIRTWVTANLVIGVLVIVVMRLGAAG